jgi:hypothetical protein
MVKFSTFFRYLTWKEKMLALIGSISAVCCGVLVPTISIVLGEIANAFDPDNSAEDLFSTMK